MTPLDLPMLLPWLFMAAAAVISVPLVAFFRSRALAMAIACTGFTGSILSCLAVAPLAPRPVTTLLIVDHYALFYTGFMALCGLAIALLAYGYFNRREERSSEFFVFLLLATFGAAVLAASSHFASFFLGLEVLSISLYVLIAFHRFDKRGIEAGLKYLILGAIAAAILLFGMGLVYADLGTMELAAVALRIREAEGGSLLFIAGLLLILVGIGFKLALVPFHLWTPDIYEGAPAPAAALIATVSKTGVLALFIRYFFPVTACPGTAVTLFLGAMAFTSMVIGNLLALRENNIKRILGFSSIAHMGYFLVAFLSGGRFGVIAATFYLVAYVITLVAAFAVLSANGEAETIDDFRHLAYRSPAVACAFTVAMASLAGLPFAAGFIGKFYVLTAGVMGKNWLLSITLALTSAIGLYYYFRIVAAMFERPPVSLGPMPAFAKMPLLGSIVLWGAVLLVVVLGVFPAPLTDLLQAVVGR